MNDVAKGPFERVVRGEKVFPPPVWMMRQAGRHLPEYREVRARAGSFLDLCYTPELATEVTLQPIRRYGVDAAVLFSDILVIPQALGRDLRFEEGRGPVMPPMSVEDIATLDGARFREFLSPVYETVSRVRAALPAATGLIGFCGAPWTLATYMIAGHGTPDQAPARLFAYRHPEAFEALLGKLADFCASHLVNQIDAGADAVQIFDSWAGVLDEASFETFCVKPVSRIVSEVRKTHPAVPVIGFPKGAGSLYAGYRSRTDVDVVGLDWSVPLGQAKRLQEEGPVQGNLDPLRLVAGGEALRDGVDAILRRLGEGPLVFNLGHGVTPETPVEHVEEMIARIRGADRP